MKKTELLVSEARKLVASRHYPNVEGVFKGYKVKNGKRTKTLAVLVCVSKKLPESQLHPQDIIPKAVNVSGHNVKTDVIQSGKFKALASMPGSLDPPLIDFSGKVKSGYSCGHPAITAGSVGPFANRNGKRCLVTNAHVGANTNDGKIGDPLYYPGPYDGGGPENTISHLVATIPIEMIASNCPFFRAVVWTCNGLAKFFRRQSRLPSPIRQIANQVDCCAHELMPEIEIDEIIPYIGKPTGIIEAELGMKLQALGRTTGYTQGEVIGTEGSARVSYDSQGTAMYEDQILSDIRTDGGDSGSVALHGTKLVGLRFAGTGSFVLMNKMQTVFDELGLERIGSNE